MSSDERFAIDILRQTRHLLDGHRADLGLFQVSWRSLTDPVERRHRRECLALLEAMVAVAGHDDPVAPMAKARREIGEVDPWARSERLFVRWLAVGAAIIAAAALLGSAIG